MTEVIEMDAINRPTVRPTMISQAYHNNQAIWIMPTRGAIPLQVHVSLRNMAWLPNTPRAHLEEEHMEVGAAYERMFDMAMTRPECAPMPWIWTYEEDNVQPKDVFLKLFDAIWKCIDCGAPMPADRKGTPAEPWVCPNGHKGLDAVAGLYRTKTEPSMYMAYGDPKDEGLDFRPLDVSEAEQRGETVEVNGVAMGSTLWRKAIFSKVSRPWFKTLTGAEGENIGSYTQDLYFCRKAKEEIGARFAVHCGVSVGHLDVETGELY